MPDLPSGTVTFLFTDIEGSTRLWERHPVAMQVALARHDALMRTVIVEHDGTVFKTVGDAFCAAFHTAADGLAAAGAAQRALAAESWPAPVGIKVRMALHTGAAEVRDNDYFGQPLNRVARLLSAGHGGQVLLSLAAQELVRDSLPPGVVLRDMGERRLKDLIRPERVYQVVVPQLPADFPPLNTLDARAHNLPVQATSFVGREREMAEVKALLASARLVTVTGAGGAGKTRLALQVGAERIDEYADGVWFVELAPLTEGRMVPQAVATALGVKEQPGVQVADTLARELKHKELLLLLDNCEHLVDACARLGEVLLGACAKVRVLATSREALRVPGEATYRVPSLATPDPKATPSIAALTQYAAVQLFIDRARAVQSTFEVNHQNAPALASICHHLDGIPLALELAAARVRSLSVEEINQRLDQRFRLLTGGARTALPRQQTLRAAIDWSYELLGAIEQALFARLAVFAGGWTLEAAERVCAGDPVVGADVLDLLTSLADKSLVLAEERNGATRYRLLETVRQYARDRLRERGEEPMWSSRHLAYFGALAEEAEPQLRGVQPRVWLDRLESEHDNLRAALAWSASAADANADAGLRLASLLWEFWSIRGYLAEGRNWFAALLAVAPHGPSAVRAKALGSAGNLARIEGDFPAARALYEECLALRRTMGDRRGLASSFVSLGILASDQGDYPAARMLYEEALQIYRDLDDRSGIAFTSTNLGITALRSGDYPAARTLHSESLALRQAAGDRLGISKSLNNLGVVAYYMNDYPAARARFEESLAVVRDLGDRRGTANALINLGGLASCQGDPVSARRFLEESLAISRELGSPASVGLALINLGDLASDQGDHASARALLAECLAIFRALGDHKNIATALNMLGTLAFEQGDQKGARAHYEEALAARQHLGDRAGVAQSLRQLGRLATVQRDYRAARILLEQSLTILVQMRDQLGVAALLEALARVAFALAQTDRAARLWGRAEGLREEIAMPLPPKDRPEYECLVAAARTVRGDDAAFDEAWREGRAMTLDQAIDYALVHPEAT